MIETVKQFRKKYTLAILLYITGSILAFTNDATLGEYSVFAGVLLAIFGGADLVDKKVENK